QCSVTFHNSNKNGIQLIEFFGGVDLVEKECIILLPESSIVIGNHIKIRYTWKDILTFRSLEFMCNNFSHVKEFHIIDGNDPQMMDVVHALFEKKLDTITDIVEIEATFSQFYEQISPKIGDKVRKNRAHTTNVID